MLTEHFIASVGVPTSPPPTNVAKDAAIFVHEFQPLAAQRNVFKKSATPPNCLAVSSLHIFAAQAEKAVVHVYSREKGNQEATVPFTERITCITLACDESILILGTVEGRILAWEVATGRLVSTAQAHLQAVTALAVDPMKNFLLSSSKDATVHVWSIPALLTFADTTDQLPSPIQTFSSHQAEITSLVIGHSSNFCNFAISASSDKTCLIWDFHTNTLLRTYLLPSDPTCLVLDVADRYLYIGYEDGEVQQLDLYTPTAGTKPGSIYEIKDALAPVQPSPSSKWRLSDRSVGAALSLSVSWDGATLLSGHESGSILTRDVTKGALGKDVLQNPLPGPVTNLAFLPVSGFPHEKQQNLKVSNVIKPKFGAFDTSSGTLTGTYALNVEMISTLPKQSPSAFDIALTAPSFPSNLLDDGLSELLLWSKGGQFNSAAAQEEESEDFMALDDTPSGPRQLSLEEQNSELKAELQALRRLQSASFEKMEKINAERKALLEREQKRLTKLKVNGAVATTNGIRVDDRKMDDMDYSSSSED